tara:strand:- start:178 stop:369 length:192 start_codon:yes stop_codon:yes gene_type:complete
MAPRKEKRSEEFKRLQKQELSRKYYEKHKIAIRQKKRGLSACKIGEGLLQLKVKKGIFVISFD